jgi:hypothetical protein
MLKALPMFRHQGKQGLYSVTHNTTIEVRQTAEPAAPFHNVACDRSLNDDLRGVDL